MKQPKFRIWNKIVVTSDWSVKYLIVKGIIDCWEFFEYVLDRNNTVRDDDKIREPTDLEVWTFYL